MAPGGSFLAVTLSTIALQLCQKGTEPSGVAGHCIKPRVRSLWIPWVRSLWIPLVRPLWIPWVRPLWIPWVRSLWIPWVRPLWIPWVRPLWIPWIRSRNLVTCCPWRLAPPITTRG
uniref:Uncharacterized protein n=1 Tax=Oncorhynchus mykiss TaxID=8022 RepID=A0A8K9WU23_ONCMY